MPKKSKFRVVSKVYETASGEKIKLNITDKALAKVCDFKHGDYIRRNTFGNNKSIVIGEFNNELYVIDDDYDRYIVNIVFSKNNISNFFDKIDEIPPEFKKYKTKTTDIYVKLVSCGDLNIGDKVLNIESGAEGEYVGVHPFFGKERPCILYDFYKIHGIIGWTDFEDLEKIG